jgi:hypothetical protein
MEDDPESARRTERGSDREVLADACELEGVFPSGMVVTIEGERPIDAIYPGDILMTLGHIGYSPVQRVTEVTFDASQRPDATPILVRAGAIDLRSPLRDTILAPQTLLGIDDRLVRVGALVNGRSIAPARKVGRIRYLRIEMLVHEMVIVDGVRVATQRCGGPLCRPLLEAGAMLDAIRARIAARIDRPGAPAVGGAAAAGRLPMRRLS